MRIPKATLAQQCEGIGWSITNIVAHKNDKRSWSIGGGPYGLPEEVVSLKYAEEGARVSYCEGASVLLLLKAAALEALAKLNTFNDREDAIVRYLEAQMTILKGHTDEIVDTVLAITPNRLECNVRELVGNIQIRRFFPRVRADFMLDLYNQMNNEMLASILKAFSVAPYDYRAGWPDLIVLNDESINFVEVKTSDRLLDTQLRFANGIGNPMRFDCGVVRLIASRESK